MNAEMISNVVDVELILEDIKYSLKVSVLYAKKPDQNA